MKVFGLKQCDTCRKALKFLDAAGADYEFVDLRESPVSTAQLTRWLASIGPAKLINRRSTTWRQLSEDERSRVMAGDVALLAASPTLIKRPLVEWGDDDSVGFDQSQWQTRL